MTAPPPYLGTAAAAQVPSAVLPEAMAPARPRLRNGWLLATLATCVIGATGIVAVVALSLVGVTVPGSQLDSGELDAAALDWAAYDDPSERFVVELPGPARVETIEVPGPMGTTEVEAVGVNGAEFSTSIVVYEQAVLPGVTFDEMPLSDSAMEAAVEENGFHDAELVDRRVVEGTGAMEVDMEMRGTVRGEAGVMFNRVVAAGDDLYEVTVVGPVEHRGELASMRDRVGTSLEVAPG